MARSLMLAPAFEEGEGVIGMAPKELEKAAVLIQSGQPFVFDTVQLALVMKHHEAARAITPRMLARDAFRWLRAPLFAIAFFLGLWFFLDR
jgi:hypothetical protein